MNDLLYDGLDLEREIRTVNAHGLGDTVLLWDSARLAGLAVCHCGPGSDAGSGVCHVKFGAGRLEVTGSLPYGLKMNGAWMIPPKRFNVPGSVRAASHA